MVVYESIYSIGQDVEIGTMKFVPLYMTRDSVQRTLSESGEVLWTDYTSLYGRYDFSANTNATNFSNLVLNGNITYEPRYGNLVGYERKMFAYHFFCTSHRIKSYVEYESWFVTNVYKNLQHIIDWIFGQSESASIKNYLSVVTAELSMLKENDYYIPVISLFLETDTYIPHILSDTDRKSYNVGVYQCSQSLSDYWKIEIRQQERKQGIVSYYVNLNYSIWNVSLPTRDVEEENSQVTDEASSEYIRNQLESMEADEDSSTYNVPEDAWDWLNRTVNFRTHVTHWNASGTITPVNESYVRFLDSNCYAYIQPVWKAGTEYWRMNHEADVKVTDDGEFKLPDAKKRKWYDSSNTECAYEDSWIYTNEYLRVYSAYYDTTGKEKVGTRDKDNIGKNYDSNVWAWYPFVLLPNGQGHNVERGDTLGVEAKWAYVTDVPELNFHSINSAAQSAVCFTNVVNLTQNQKVVYAYTEGDDHSIISERGEVPVITMDVSGQMVSRIDLELNNTLTRW